MKNLKTLLKEGILDSSIDDLNTGATAPFINEYRIEDIQFYFIDDDGYWSGPYYEHYFDVKRLVKDVKKEYGLRSSMDELIESAADKNDWDIVKSLIILLEHCSALSYQDDYIGKLREYLFPGFNAKIATNKSLYSGKEYKWKIEIDSKSNIPPLFLYFRIKKSNV